MFKEIFLGISGLVIWGCLFAAKGQEGFQGIHGCGV
jgi:hypothetical protein